MLALAHPRAGARARSAFGLARFRGIHKLPGHNQPSGRVFWGLGPLPWLGLSAGIALSSISPQTLTRFGFRSLNFQNRSRGLST
ncbi:hypothetical protein L3X38_010337 [Prunus dulcis]|uniref:Uncharacterized protein n=1 Tax=Prunus dulcis TaxID=3755 RepID=A0AAD4WHL1_PRUDU|nr:hypothetical protein L3X38_010337 [Prunus dulcis]